MAEHAAGKEHALTLRALGAGLLLAFAVGAAGPYCTLYLQGSNAGDVFYTSPVAHLLFFALVGVINVALKALCRPWALHTGELLVVYIMMVLANASHTLVYYWVAMLAGPFYYATPENDWASLIHPYIPAWIAPTDPRAIQLFFEGGQSQDTLPWKVWLVPLMAWLPLIVALHLAMLCLMVIVRRQWAERERLVYPLIQLPLAMVQSDERDRAVGPFFRSGTMWLGFAVPLAVGCVQGLHHYYPFVPPVQLSTSLELFRNTVSIPVILSFATLGFFFLIKREVAFGLWVFFLFNILQQGLYSVVGLGAEREAALSVWSYNIPSLVHQNMGAMIVLGAGMVWVGREHIGAVLRAAWQKETDDSGEIISYRGAVLCLAGSLLTMVVWLRLTGIPLFGVLVFLFFAFVVFVVLTRVIVEGGVAVLYPPLVAPDAALSAIGTPAFGSAGLVGMVFTRIWANDILNFAMPHCANGLKLSEQIHPHRRWLFAGMLLGILAGLGGALWMLLELCYRYGAINLRPAHFIWLPHYVYEYAAARMSAPSNADAWGWFHTGVGGLVMAGLMLARRFWSWWPLHPLGFPISSVFSWMAFNAFLAWLIKGVILRYGGPRLYRQVRPFFLGMILGQFVVYGLFWIIDSLTGAVGNILLV